MPKMRYYNPQDDVVQIKDGQRIQVKPYDMYGEMHKELKVSTNTQTTETTPKEISNEGLSMRFDGQYLTLIHKEGNKTTEYNFPAVSGRQIEGEKDTFSYSKERQKIENVGPIPEGKHQVDLKSTNYWKNAGLWQRTKSFLGGGEFPGGPYAWGEGHIDIKLEPKVAQETGRRGITIHGGEAPGSAGCIDLVNNDKAFFDKLEELKGNQTRIPLTVDYSKTPQKVKWNPSEKPIKKEKSE